MDWLANRAGKLVVSRRVICMSEREEEEEEDDSMEGFTQTPIRASRTLCCQILFPRLWIFFAIGEGKSIGRVTAENSRFVWLLLYALIGGVPWLIFTEFLLSVSFCRFFARPVTCEIEPLKGAFLSTNLYLSPSFPLFLVSTVHSSILLIESCD